MFCTMKSRRWTGSLTNKQSDLLNIKNLTILYVLSHDDTAISQRKGKSTISPWIPKQLCCWKQK